MATGTPSARTCCSTSMARSMLRDQDALRHLDAERRRVAVAAPSSARCSAGTKSSLRSCAAATLTAMRGAGRPASRQLRQSCDGALHDLLRHFADQAGGLQRRHELARRHQAARRVHPAHQRLDADDAAGGQVHLRLVVVDELALLQRARAAAAPAGKCMLCTLSTERSKKAIGCSRSIATCSAVSAAFTTSSSVLPSSGKEAKPRFTGHTSDRSFTS